MSRKKKERKYCNIYLSHRDIHNGEMECPICGRSVSAFRIALFLKEGNAKHSNYLPGKECVICHK